MHIVVFGLSISSSWGNGHATLWRSLVKAMLHRGHTVSFYERDVAFYANTRDLFRLPRGGKLEIYESLEGIAEIALRDLDRADLAICTSFCVQGPAVCDLLLSSEASIKAFYDLDTPVTLDGLQRGLPVDYLPHNGLGDFDLVLSYTGGRALDELGSRLGARFAAPLYGSVDPETHYPVPARAELRSALSYLGTYAQDRQEMLECLFVEPARQLPDAPFLIGGAQYPDSFPWTKNISFVQHLPASLHPAFFCSSRATLNVTRRAMASYGYCPSGRLFEAAACGVPILTDTWDGLALFFEPGREIVPVRSSEEVLDALSLPDSDLHLIATRARERVLSEHTGEHRVIELENLCSLVRSGRQKEEVA